MYAEVVHEHVTGKCCANLDLPGSTFPEFLQEKWLFSVKKPLRFIGLDRHIRYHADCHERSKQNMGAVRPNSLDAGAIVKGSAFPSKRFPHNILTSTAHVL